MTLDRFRTQDFGLDMERRDFDQYCITEFDLAYPTWTVDELLLHPANALQFCTDVRKKHKWHSIPDDIILRVILRARKDGQK